MIEEMVLVGALVLSLGFHLVAESRWTKERSRLINALMSRSAPEFMAIERALHPPLRRSKNKKDPEAPTLPIGI